MPHSMPPSGERQSHTSTQFYREPGRKTIYLGPNATNGAATFALSNGVLVLFLRLAAEHHGRFGTISPLPPA